jgi:hypothetical protein
MLDIEADTPLRADEARDADRLVTLAQSLGVDGIDLFEAVHDAASRYASDECNNTGAVDDDDAADEVYDEAGHGAAEINNGGLDSQVPYLVSQYGAAEAEEVIRESSSGSPGGEGQ